MAIKRIPPVRLRTAPPDEYDTMLAVVSAAREERRRICNLNLLAAPGDERARLAPETRAILGAETAARRALKKKTPEDWARDIGQLGDAMRNRVACIVWWDFFSARPAKKPWPHLNEWLKTERECVEHDDLARALWRAGFTPAHAATRAAGEWEEGVYR